MEFQKADWKGCQKELYEITIEITTNSQQNIECIVDQLTHNIKTWKLKQECQEAKK